MKEQLEAFLQQQCRQLKPSRVRDAMEYSLMGRGKRLRPMLLFAVLEGYGLNPKIGMAAAGALEMMHTYSLIHDDLPAMDNDDFRRGRKTCHRQFDEATAILAGDGLLTLSFELAARSSEDSAKAVQIVSELAHAGGAEGMILGQTCDLAAENHPQMTLEQLRQIHLYKTGCLFTAPLVIGAILAGRSQDISLWRKTGSLMGLAFQIQDDILDVTQSSEQLGKSASDLDNHKATYVTLLGLGQAQDFMMDAYRQTRAALAAIDLDPAPVVAILDAMEFRQY